MAHYNSPEVDTLEYDGEDFVKGVWLHDSPFFRDIQVANIADNVLVYQNILNHLQTDKQNRDAWVDAKYEIERNLKYNCSTPYQAIQKIIKAQHNIDIANPDDLKELYIKGQQRAENKKHTRAQLKNDYIKPLTYKQTIKKYRNLSDDLNAVKKYHKKKQLYLEKNFNKPTINVDEKIQ